MKMKLIGLALLAVALALTAAPNVAGFAQYAGQDVITPMYLVELDYQADGDLAMVKETIIFRNIGEANYTDGLRTVVSEDSEIMHVLKMGHEMNVTPEQVEYERDGEILRWGEDGGVTIEPGAMVMYAVTYTTPIRVEGTVTKSGEFVKKFAYPAVVNYPIGSLRLKVRTDARVKFTDENGNVIKPDRVDPEDDGGVLYSWTESVTFRELHIKLSQPSNTDKLIGYAVVAILIICALTYPILHVRVAKLREKQGGAKISCARCSVCDDGGRSGGENGGKSSCEGADKRERAGDWDEMDEIIVEVTQSKEALTREKNAILSVLNKLEEDYKKGEVADDDYKRLTSKYEKKAIEIMKQIDRL